MKQNVWKILARPRLQNDEKIVKSVLCMALEIGIIFKIPGDRDPSKPANDYRVLMHRFATSARHDIGAADKEAEVRGDQLI